MNKNLEYTEIISQEQLNRVISEYKKNGYKLRLVYEDLFSEVSAGGSVLVIDSVEKIMYIE